VYSFLHFLFNISLWYCRRRKNRVLKLGLLLTKRNGLAELEMRFRPGLYADRQVARKGFNEVQGPSSYLYSRIWSIGNVKSR